MLKAIVRWDRAAYGNALDGGLRTLSGGQFALQVDGPIAIQSGAVPSISVDASHAVRDVFAFVTEPPTGSPIQIRVTRDEITYCTLTIAEGETISNAIDGTTLPPLEAGWKLSMDVVTVGQTTPGSSLTVTVRL